MIFQRLHTNNTGSEENSDGDSVVQSEHDVVNVDGVSLHHGLDIAGDV